MPVVISDSGPLIALSKLDLLDVLPKLYGEIWLTPQVADKSLVVHRQVFEGQAALAAAMSDWLVVQSDLEAEFEPTEAAIDEGEYSSIRLCLKHPGSLLIIDDHAGKREAKAQKIAVIGVVGVLMLAKQRGLIESLCKTLLALQNKGYFLSDALIAQAVLLVGETKLPPLTRKSV